MDSEGEAYLFSQYPQPPRRPEEDLEKERPTAHLNDSYLDALEIYIDELSNFIRDVQKAEVSENQKLFFFVLFFGFTLLLFVGRECFTASLRSSSSLSKARIL